MEKNAKDIKDTPLAKPLTYVSNLPRILILVVVLSLLAGTATGYLMARKSGGLKSANILNQPPKSASQDTRTFRDFAEGKVAAKPEPSDPTEYTEGTHVLVREGTVSVALTSSVVDLSKYENKKVKVFGETQKALKEGWLMDVGRVEEVK